METPALDGRAFFRGFKVAPFRHFGPSLPPFSRAPERWSCKIEKVGSTRRVYLPPGEIDKASKASTFQVQPGGKAELVFNSAFSVSPCKFLDLALIQLYGAKLEKVGLRGILVCNGWIHSNIFLNVICRPLPHHFQHNHRVIFSIGKDSVLQRSLQSKTLFLKRLNCKDFWFYKMLHQTRCMNHTFLFQIISHSSQGIDLLYLDFRTLNINPVGTLLVCTSNSVAFI